MIVKFLILLNMLSDGKWKLDFWKLCVLDMFVDIKKKCLFLFKSYW